VTRPLRVVPLEPNTVDDVMAMWSTIDLKPIYQRQSDIWQEAKRQLFVDSLINGYDVPKLYFHDLSWKDERPRKRYAIIDGKQRLEAIRAFIAGDFSLSADFVDLGTTEELADRAAGLSYKDLARKCPGLRARFNEASLPIFLVQTENREYIEEMFSRLNEAVPLNAPEKRNAFGGPLPSQIRGLARDEFFASRIAFQNSRYKHLDLATKFLYVEHRNALDDLKKRDLDAFVRLYKKRNWRAKASGLRASAALILEKMSAVFGRPDPLLDSVGMVTVYYWLFREAFHGRWLGHITHAKLMSFDQARRENRAAIREAQDYALENRTPPRSIRVNSVLAAFERYVQSPNDVTALTQRYKILRVFIETGEVPKAE